MSKYCKIWAQQKTDYCWGGLVNLRISALVPICFLDWENTVQHPPCLAATFHEISYVTLISIIQVCSEPRLLDDANLQSVNKRAPVKAFLDKESF